MKHPLATITLFSLAALTIGCDSKTTSEQIGKLKSETKQAGQDLKDYDYAQKSEFVAGMKAELDAVNLELDALAAKVANSSDAAKAEAAPKLQSLRDQSARLSRQLDQAGNATESTWSEVKSGFRTGYAELKDGFNEARAWVSEKIAP